MPVDIARACQQSPFDKPAPMYETCRDNILN